MSWFLIVVLCTGSADIGERVVCTKSIHKMPTELDCWKLTYRLDHMGDLKKGKVVLKSPSVVHSECVAKKFGEPA